MSSSIPPLAALSPRDRKQAQTTPGRSIILIAAVNTASVLSSWKLLEFGRSWFLNTHFVHSCLPEWFRQFLGLHGAAVLWRTRAGEAL